MNTALSFAGAGLGFVNQVVLMAGFFTPEELGLTRVLFQSGTLLAQFMVFGTNPLVIRFYRADAPPVLRNLRLASAGILAFGALISVLALWVFQKPFIAFYVEKSVLFATYAYWAVPLALGLAVFQLLAAWAQSAQRSVLETGLKEVGLRLLITIGISAYLFDWVSFEAFVRYYAWIPMITALALGAALWPRRTVSRDQEEESSVPWKVYLLFSAYNVLSRASNFITLTIDVLFLGALVGLEAVAVYSIATYLVGFMMIPYRALQKVAFPRVARWWQDNDRASIQKLYGETASGLLFWSGTIFVGLSLCLPWFNAYLGPEYSGLGLVFSIFGLGRLVEMITSINRGILRNSPLFRFETLYSLIFMGTLIGLDLWLIPVFEQLGTGRGVEGAAWGSAGAFLLFNTLISSTLFFAYGMMPFRPQQLILAVWFFLSWFFLPRWSPTDQILLDAFIRAAIFGLSAIGIFMYWYQKKANRDWLTLK